MLEQLEQPAFGYEMCDACGNPSACTQQEHYPDDGLSIDFRGSGYYGGFTDNYPTSKSDREWLMCHDCVIKLLNTFPMLAANVGRGQHPCSNDAPCCKWAWRINHETNETEYGTEDGKWVKKGV